MTLEQLNLDKSTWQKVKLGDTINLLDRMRKPVSKSDRESGEYPYYGANGIQDYVSSYIFEGKYILVGEDGSVITPDGHPVVNWGTGKFWANNHVHIFENKNGYSLEFLYYAICYSNVTNMVHGNIPKLTKSDLLNIEILIPSSLDEQIKIANLLESYDKLIESEQSKYGNLLYSVGGLLDH